MFPMHTNYLMKNSFHLHPRRLPTDKGKEHRNNGIQPTRTLSSLSMQKLRCSHRSSTCASSCYVMTLALSIFVAYLHCTHIIAKLPYLKGDVALRYVETVLKRATKQSSSHNHSEYSYRCSMGKKSFNGNSSTTAFDSTSCRCRDFRSMALKY